MQKKLSWQEMTELAVSLLDYRQISPFISAAKASAVLQTDSGHIYTGVSLHASCDLGLCAERSAIIHMITNREQRVTKLVCLYHDRHFMTPCGACRELLMQLDADSPQMQILIGTDPIKIVTLGELMPDWWGEARFLQKIKKN